MTDLSIQTIPGEAPSDHTWLAGDHLAFETAQSGTLDVSKLTSGTHYDADTGTVPSGLAVARQADGTYAPYVYEEPVADTDPSATAILAGFVARNVKVKRENGTTSSKVLFARVVDATIVPANLPVAAQRTIDRSVPTTGKFGFVTK